MPGGYYANFYRSQGEQTIGAQVRFPGAEGETAYGELAADREAIDAEFAEAGLPPLAWSAGPVPTLSVILRSPLPWDENRESEQRAWFAHAANQLVNSLRPRLQRLAAV